MAKTAKKATKAVTTKQPAKKAAAKKAAKPAAPKKAAAKKATGSAGLAAPVTPSAELASVIGNKSVPRTEIIKKIWDYIKENGLQDKQNKRMINADSKLKPVFGGKSQISMFELAKVVSNHVK